MALSHSCHESSLSEHEATRLVGHVGAEVLLKVRVLVVVDSHELVAGLGGEVGDEGGLAAAGGALEQDGVLPEGRRGEEGRVSVAKYFR